VIPAKGDNVVGCDGGFTKLDDIEKVHAAGVDVFTPPPRNKHDTDTLAPRADDGPGTAAWRKRMSSDEGKAVYRSRAKAGCKWRRVQQPSTDARGRQTGCSRPLRHKSRQDAEAGQHSKALQRA
jgi:hypothetical protein